VNIPSYRPVGFPSAQLWRSPATKMQTPVRFGMSDDDFENADDWDSDEEITPSVRPAQQRPSMAEIQAKRDRVTQVMAGLQTKGLPNVGEMLTDLAEILGITPDQILLPAPVTKLVKDPEDYAELAYATLRVLPHTELDVILPFDSPAAFHSFRRDKLAQHMGLPKDRVGLSRVVNFSNQVLLAEDCSEVYAPAKSDDKGLIPVQRWLSFAEEHLGKLKGKILVIVHVTQTAESAAKRATAIEDARRAAEAMDEYD
jgi:hypothetical protein